MKDIALSELILSMGQSVESSTLIMKKNDTKVRLEEFECTLTLDADIDEKSLKKQRSGLTPNTGLKFLEVNTKKNKFTATLPSTTPVSSPSPEKGVLTIRAIFSSSDN